MAVDAHKNFAVSKVASAPSPAASGTSLTVTTGHGSRFPVPPFNATVWQASVLPDPTNAEIVRVTGISGDTLTVTRAQEGSSARTIIVGDQIAATITAKTFTDVEAMVTAGPTGPTGPTGATGPAGTGFTPRGAWDASTTYALNNIVTRGGSTYRGALVTVAAGRDPLTDFGQTDIGGSGGSGTGYGYTGYPTQGTKFVLGASTQLVGVRIYTSAGQALGGTANVGIASSLDAGATPAVTWVAGPTAATLPAVTGTTDVLFAVPTTLAAGTYYVVALANDAAGAQNWVNGDTAMVGDGVVSSVETKVWRPFLSSWASQGIGALRFRLLGAGTAPWEMWAQAGAPGTPASRDTSFFLMGA